MPWLIKNKYYELILNCILYILYTIHFYVPSVRHLDTKIPSKTTTCKKYKYGHPVFSHNKTHCANIVTKPKNKWPCEHNMYLRFHSVAAISPSPPLSFCFCLSLFMFRSSSLSLALLFSRIFTLYFVLGY